MLKLESAATAAAMSVIDAIYERRSVRSYRAKTVDRRIVSALLDAAVQAPTALHEEPWAFAVVQDRDALRRLSDAALKTLQDRETGLHLPRGSQGFTLPENVFYDAGTLIVIYGKPLGPFVAADCWLAAENLMLAARGMGLGSCVIGLAAAALNSPEWKAELKVPAGLTAYAPVIVGEPSGETPAAGRREPEVLSWRTGLSA